VTTAACLVLVNLVIALVIVHTFYPAAPVRVGAAVLGALALAAVGCLVYVALGWREYLRRRPDA
jgi:hypothetical protein